VVTAELDKSWRRVVAKAWADAAFKERLLDDPEGVLRAEGLVLPAGRTARVIEAGPDEALFVLPPQPAAHGGPAAEEERISPIMI